MLRITGKCTKCVFRAFAQITKEDIENYFPYVDVGTFKTTFYKNFHTAYQTSICLQNFTMAHKYFYTKYSHSIHNYPTRGSKGNLRYQYQLQLQDTAELSTSVRRCGICYQGRYVKLGQRGSSGWQ